MRSVCQSVLARRLQQIHYRPRLRGSLRNLVREGGKGKGGEGAGGGGGRTEREVHAKKKRNNAASVRACNKRTEGTCLNFRARPLLTQKDGLYIPSLPPPPPPHHHHPPHTPHPTPPSPSSSSHPTTNRERRGEKKNLLLRAQLCMHFFYLVLVDVMGKLSLSLSPSLPPASSPRRSAVCLGYARAFHRAARSTPNAGLPSVSGNFKVMPPPQPNITAGIFEGSVRHSMWHAGPK